MIGFRLGSQFRFWFSFKKMYSLWSSSGLAWVITQIFHFDDISLNTCNKILGYKDQIGKVNITK